MGDVCIWTYMVEGAFRVPEPNFLILGALLYRSVCIPVSKKKGSQLIFFLEADATFKEAVTITAARLLPCIGAVRFHESRTENDGYRREHGNGWHARTGDR